MNDSHNNEVIHRWRGGQSLRSIARELGISRWKVSQIIGQHQASRDEGELSDRGELPAPKSRRGSKLDAFADQLHQLLQRYPNMTATRIFEELKKLGYTGGFTILRERVKSLRAEPTRKLVTRFETAPGLHYDKRCAMLSV